MHLFLRSFFQVELLTMCIRPLINKPRVSKINLSRQSIVDHYYIHGIFKILISVAVKAFYTSAMLN